MRTLFLLPYLRKYYNNATMRLQLWILSAGYSMRLRQHHFSHNYEPRLHISQCSLSDQINQLIK